MPKRFKTQEEAQIELEDAKLKLEEFLATQSQEKGLWETAMLSVAFKRAANYSALHRVIIAHYFLSLASILARMEDPEPGPTKH